MNAPKKRTPDEFDDYLVRRQAEIERASGFGPPLDRLTAALDRLFLGDGPTLEPGPTPNAVRALEEIGLQLHWIAVALCTMGGAGPPSRPIAFPKERTREARAA